MAGSEKRGKCRLVETEDDLAAFHQDGALDQVGMFGHEPQGLGARRRVLFHAVLPIELIARVEEQPVIPLADELLQAGGGESAVEIDFLKHGVLFAKQTLRFAA